MSAWFQNLGPRMPGPTSTGFTPWRCTSRWKRCTLTPRRSAASAEVRVAMSERFSTTAGMPSSVLFPTGPLLHRRKRFRRVWGMSTTEQTEVVPRWTTGERLRKARIVAGLTPEEMAAGPYVS